MGCGGSKASQVKVAPATADIDSLNSKLDALSKEESTNQVIIEASRVLGTELVAISSQLNSRSAEILKILAPAKEAIVKAQGAADEAEVEDDSYIDTEIPPCHAECVLNDMPLKFDHFENIHKLPAKEVVPGRLLTGDDRREVAAQVIEGVGNFRKIEGYPIFGVFQCAQSGIKKVCDHVKGLGYKKILWASMREEPVVFVKDLPYAPREHGKLNDNVDYLLGINGHELERMEQRMKQDVIEKFHDGKFKYFHQLKDMSNEERTIEFKKDEVCTLRETYVKLVKEGYKVTYRRIPIQDECPPDSHALDSLINLVKRADKDTALIFNCQMGRGRTTTAMVCAALIFHIQHPELYGKTVKIGASLAELKMRQSHLGLNTIGIDRPATEQEKLNGNYKVIKQVVHLLDEGQTLKEEVDKIIDASEHMQNMRTAIKECKDASTKNTGEEGRDANFWLRRGTNYLQRYWALIVFNAYLHHKDNPFDTTFTEWSRQRWALKRMLNMVSLD
eukprot:Nk52_evm35s250 gene=Nk52_evmTU35s250